MDQLRWRLVWESDLSDEEHAALARLFGRAYPRHAERFSGGRSWSGARPEARVVGSLDDRPVAHLGLLRRFLRVPATGASLLVGDVGLVAVDPDLQGRGIGRRLLDQARQVLLKLELPFGFLTCGPETVPFYRSGGWRLLEGQTTRMIDNRQRSEVYQGPALLLPVRARLTDWPHGHTVDRNGLEV
jgi:nodulation protein A